MNIAPSRSRTAAAGAPAVRADRDDLCGRLGGAARRQSRRQAAAAGRRDGATRSDALAFEPDRRTGEYRAVDRHRGEPAAARARARHRDAGRSCLRARDRHPAVRRARRSAPLVAVHLDGPADGDPADPVHRLRTRRAFQGRPDRLRRRAVPDPRPRAGASARCRASRSSRRSRSAPRPGRWRSASCCRRSCRG